MRTTKKKYFISELKFIKLIIIFVLFAIVNNNKRKEKKYPLSFAAIIIANTICANCIILMIFKRKKKINIIHFVIPEKGEHIENIFYQYFLISSTKVMVGDRFSEPNNTILYSTKLANKIRSWN